MNDQQFFDLAMKDIAGHTSSAEKADLQAWMNEQPAAKAEYGRLQSQTRMAKEMAPLLQALNHPAPVELPEYARERLNAKLKRTFPKPEPAAKVKWSWQWVLALSACVIVIGLIVVNQLQPSAPVIQLAMVDTIGNVRSGSQGIDPAKTMTSSGLADTITKFDDNVAAIKWREQYPTAKAPVFKVIYDRDRGVVEVFHQGKGKLIHGSFPVKDESALPGVLGEVSNWIKQQGQR